ncbi:chaperone protein dnaJ 11, chloroplastic-like [Durio zibethinus]|uniref:Chaperone protein dnaJ 11, chloroplastic-like n=1 Tax=Durio zibethinus TaxID=66656 RepID=A0A6P5XF81_DURZI|nr:chaperone protein dnaJ 11, chloroplastic-like [Durio zibethinus]
MASSTSLYEVLGITMSADGNEIKAAYRRLARTCHPDVVSINQKEMSANQFRKIHAAYSTLSDPEKRADYDRDLYMRNRRFHSSALTSATMAAAGEAAAVASSSGFSGYSSRRNWETDQCW